MKLLDTVITFLKTEFDYLFTAVSGIFTTIVSEIPDDEIAILHGAMNTAADSLKAGRSAEEAFSDALNFLQQQELKELSKVGDLLLQAFIQATAPKASPTT